MSLPGEWHKQHPLIGQILANRYQVASFIREGGMAQIFCGLQADEPRHVAIKVVHPELAQDPEIVARFLREAELAARLIHPNIVRILAVGEEGDLLYMIMELLFGEDLSAPIKQKGSFSEARAAQAAIFVCDALQHAHERGIIHRDIKPENIMICRQPDAPAIEVVKVLDFGIAKILDAKGVDLPTAAPTSIRSVLTRVGALVGTPAYISPEQGRAEPIDHRADIYSLGVVLYEMACGRPPFEGQTALHLVARHVQETPPAPSTHCAVHPGLEQVILKTLAKRPADRYQSARELGDALRALMPELSAAPIDRWLQTPASAPGPWAASPMEALGATIGATAAGTPSSDSEFDGARTTRLEPPSSVDPLLQAGQAQAGVDTGVKGMLERALGVDSPRAVTNKGLTPILTPRRPQLDFRPDHPFIGRVLEGRYSVASFVREGGMAQVFCGTQAGDPPHVAIKAVHPELAQDREVVARFLREARLAARLVHPNIVRILSVGQEGDILYMVMELLFGEDLSAPIKQRGSFSELRAAQILTDVCEALHHAHDRGVVHRDIKPENVMLCRQPHAPTEEIVKVLDFGIAKVLDTKVDAPLPLEAPTGVRSVLTRVGELVGTPAYMSPEQGQAQAIDARTDIYAAGVLLYEMICGRPPFEGETPLQIIARHVHEPPRPPSQITSVHPRLEALILSMLAKDPARRPRTARAVADQLRQLQPELSSAAGVSGAPMDRWLNRTIRRSAPRQEPPPSAPAVQARTLPSQSQQRVPAVSAAAVSPAAHTDPAPMNHRPSVPPESHPPVSAPPPSAADAAQIRAMKRTVPMSPVDRAIASRRAPVAAATTQAMPAKSPSLPPRAPSTQPPASLARAEAESGPSTLGEQRLQARVDSLVRMLNILAVLVGVAFLIIVGLVVVLFAMRGGPG